VFQTDLMRRSVIFHTNLEEYNPTHGIWDSYRFSHPPLQTYIQLVQLPAFARVRPPTHPVQTKTKPTKMPNKKNQKKIKAKLKKVTK
jgi:hypothetical protein